MKSCQITKYTFKMKYKLLPEQKEENLIEISDEFEDLIKKFPEYHGLIIDENIVLLGHACEFGYWEEISFDSFMMGLNYAQLKNKPLRKILVPFKLSDKMKKNADYYYEVFREEFDFNPYKCSLQTLYESMHKKNNTESKREIKSLEERFAYLGDMQEDGESVYDSNILERQTWSINERFKRYGKKSAWQE